MAPLSILHHGKIYAGLSWIDRLDYSTELIDGAICVDFEERSHKTNDQRSDFLNIFGERSCRKYVKLQWRKLDFWVVFECSWKGKWVWREKDDGCISGCVFTDGLLCSRNGENENWDNICFVLSKFVAVLKQFKELTTHDFEVFKVLKVDILPTAPFNNVVTYFINCYAKWSDLILCQYLYCS